MDAQANHRKVILAGNGGSAAIASHVSVDLTKNAGVRAISFNESDLITCFANDFLRGNISSLKYLGPAITEPSIADDETFFPGCELPGHRLHRVGAAPRNYSGGIRVIAFLQCR